MKDGDLLGFSLLVRDRSVAKCWLVRHQDADSKR